MNTATTTEPDLVEGERALDAWEGSRDAIREGWMIFTCAGSENGYFQICAIDEPDDWIGHTGGERPVKLDSDDDAWLIARTGTGEHHRFARAFIAKYNPQEWAAIEKFCEGK